MQGKNGLLLHVLQLENFILQRQNCWMSMKMNLGNFGTFKTWLTHEVMGYFICNYLNFLILSIPKAIFAFWNSFHVNLCYENFTMKQQLFVVKDHW